jgi:hypothetical protein
VICIYCKAGAFCDEEHHSVNLVHHYLVLVKFNLKFRIELWHNCTTKVYVQKQQQSFYLAKRQQMAASALSLLFKVLKQK